VFDVGWQELFLVGLVAIIVIGPKDLPRVLRTVTLGIRKVRTMARDFQDGLDELAREADLADLRKEIEDGVGGDLKKDIESIGDPARDVEDSVREIGSALDEPEKPKSPQKAETSTATAEKPEKPVPADTVPTGTEPAAPASDTADSRKAGGDT
jgi:sec-independent protein translocase protein TatB